MRRLAILLLISAAACAAALGQTDASSSAAKICASVENLRVPTVTPESPADAKWLKGCAEDDLYYGASPHQNVDYPAARRCALYGWSVKHGPTPGALPPPKTTGRNGPPRLLCATEQVARSALPSRLRASGSKGERWK